MLKPAVAALLLANLGTVLYTQGGLRWLGLGALDEREPQRLAQQLHPEQLQLLSATPATPAPPPVATPTPTASDRPDQSCGTSGSPSENVNESPGVLTHCRPRRPLPAVCSAATSNTG